MKFKIAYHPVWEQTLTAREKEKYEQFLNRYRTGGPAISTSIVVIKQKKRGGLVATLFICNGFNTELYLQETNVKIVSATNGIIANAQFTPNLLIPPHTAMPWSFIFPKENVKCNVISEEEWTVKISLV